MSERHDVVIVGGGHGGTQLALSLRQRAFGGSIAIIGEEPELHYDRPPFSKEYLAGDKPWEKLIFKTADAWAERDVALLLGQRVVTVGAGAHSAATTDGTIIGYGILVWAAGGVPRQLACAGRHRRPHGAKPRGRGP